MSSAESTSTEVPSALRVVSAPTPVTTISLSEIAVEAIWMSTLAVCPAPTVTVCCAWSKPISVTCTVCVPAGTFRSTKRPEELESCPIPVPSTRTWALASGLIDVPSRTCPWMTPVWACTGAAASASPRSVPSVAAPPVRRL